jgi:quinohemoprotein ethanol dehydrogenase
MRLILSVCAVTALLIGCSKDAGDSAATAEAGGGAQAAAVDARRLLAANEEPGQWMAPGRTYDEQRYSPLNQINDSNVSQLGLAWYFDLNTHRGIESSPLFIDGVLYNISAWNITYAIDARTGKEL